MKQQLAIVGLAVVAGYGLGASTTDQVPSCPSEDSCTAHYVEDRWVVVDDPSGTVECDDFDGSGRAECVDGLTGQVVWAG